MDFVRIYTKESKNASKNRDSETLEVCVDFKVFKSKDIMVRGRQFYAVYDAKTGFWMQDELNVARLVDEQILEKVNELQKQGLQVHYNLMVNYNSGIWQKYTSYVKNMPDTWKPLNNKMFFANEKLTRENYATRKLSYSLKSGSIKNYDRLMSVLYNGSERDKLEWAVGAILTGDSRHIQKFIALYGSSGSGKSTFLNIVQKLVAGYYISFSAKDLVGHDSFGMEVFKSNPLVAIQHDGDLSKIEDNSLLNSIISHEEIVMNEKHKSKYSLSLNCFLFLGTNKPVAISDSKSGLLRRLIDAHPSGKLLSKNEYDRLVSDIDFEIGAIADYCILKYQKMGADYYKDYEPKEMMFETNTIYNFVFENYLIFKNSKYFQLNQLYDMYRAYCEDSGEQFPMKKRVFRAEMKTYFLEFYDVTRVDDGKQLRSVYKSFNEDIFEDGKKKKYVEEAGTNKWLNLNTNVSLFDTEYSDILAQYSNASGTPTCAWAKCITKLKDIDSSKEHYVMGMGINHIVIDFDIKDEDGNKSLALNLEAANKWPKTYAELSKSGQGIHLHYIWNGEHPEDLDRIYSPGIEVKVFTGNSSLRRKLSWCNTEPVTTITSGLKFKEKKGEDTVFNKKTVDDERHLRIMIKKCMNKEFHGATKPECDFIAKLLSESYEKGMIYDVSDMRSSVLAFAATSSNNSSYCIDLVNKMKWASEPLVVQKQDNSDSGLVFYDVEVFPNLFLVVYKIRGKDKKKITLINPTPQEIAKLFNFKLVGYNNKRYDDHIMYARYLGYTNEQLYDLSKKIISKEGSVRNGFREAYSIAYTDVYDFCSEKKSLKKWEIELGLKHQELDWDFNKPLPEELWPLAIEYCGNDVDATEAVFENRQADWIAREILAELAGGTVNMTTNQLTTRLVFGNEKHPELVYTNMEDIFPGYEFARDENNKLRNMYRGTDVSMGGYIHAEPGMYYDVELLDIESMHPSSAIILNYFGKYTPNFKRIKDARTAIKNGMFDRARELLGKEISDKYLVDKTKADDLAYALKIAINSAYGLTSAAFENAMRDKRNVNNIVALYGALFMRTLQDEVQARGFTVAHIKTDSIKIPNATPEIIEFCKEFAIKYGFIFKHEATYEKMCLVNKAVYIAKYKWAEKKKLIGTWTAVGDQFAEPFVYKTLFSRETVVFDDYKQIKSVTNPASIYLDFDENLKEGEHNYVHVGRVGSFVPILPGNNGGRLLRITEDKNSFVSGSKGYRWKESEVVKNLKQEDQIDLSYFYKLLHDAVEKIKEYCDIEDLVEDYNKLVDSRIIDDVEDGIIGFDDCPPLPAVANAILLKGV